ncbi:MAG: PDZ domain-containing protein [Fimbriimonadaceae bacterium]|nr:MAG: PDZ domain-containing protein [Fimbriimonadaceae bacterium]
MILTTALFLSLQFSAQPNPQVKTLGELPIIGNLFRDDSKIPHLKDLPLIGDQFGNGPTVLPRRGSLGLPYTPVQQDPNIKSNPTAVEGLRAGTPVPELTAANAGIKAGDLITHINGKPAFPATLNSTLRGIPVGQPIEFTVIRDGQTLTLRTPLTERPRDPGNANFEVIYTHIVSNGERMRTIITKPKKPGKHPALMFIQGFSPVSYDYTLETATGDVATLDGPILYDFANSGFVTLRIEKPGVGDSEGGPFAPMDYITELDIYRQALIQLKEFEGVDKDNVFIFGHSMGGAFGPMIAAENPVKGIAVYGVASRTWFEYLVDIMRYQTLVAGASYEEADEAARQGTRMMALIMLEKKSPEEVKKSHPELAPLVDGYFPDGLFNGKSLDFWRQLGEVNFAHYWSKVNTHVLAVKGEADFVVYDVDHKLIADIVNRANPGFGSFVIAPDSDHLFHNFDTEVESRRNFQKGKFNPGFTKIMKDWILSIMNDRSGS